MLNSNVRGVGKSYSSSNWKVMCDRIYCYSNAYSDENTNERDIMVFKIFKMLEVGFINETIAKELIDGIMV